MSKLAPGDCDRVTIAVACSRCCCDDGGELVLLEDDAGDTTEGTGSAAR